MIKPMQIYTTALALMWLSAVSIAWAKTEATETPAVEQSAADIARFPRRYEGNLGTVVAHAPQIDSWEKFKRVTARSAVAVTPAGETDPAYGVIEYTANTDTNLERHLVSVEGLKITSVSFPEASAKQKVTLERVLRATLPSANKLMPLDVVLNYIAPSAAAPEEEGLSFNPPPIFYSSTPAFLVMTDGEPLLAPIKDSKLKYVINTNWDVFRYKDKHWYLREDTRWLKSKAEGLDGKWKYTKRIPKDFSKLPDDENWKAVKSAIPPEKTKKPVPTLFVSERPAELILLDGNPAWSTVGPAGLRYVTNTESDLFIWEKNYYYLVSGRWFTAQKLRGPWAFVKELPEAFAAIPQDHPKAHVRAAIAGTEEARLATLEAMLPRKTTIRRDAGKNIIVVYQGEPKFEAIDGTSIMRAANSPDDVVKVGDTYYLCANAVWYTSAAPTGPWMVADSIPAEIYKIPAASPSYHVTHVHVYESNHNTVSSGYTSGYFGTYVSYGVVMYGSGWYYPPYYYYNPYYYGGYPIYYAYPYSYGSSSWYNPNTGMYGRSNSVYGPYGGYGRGASYNPKTGTYARGEAVWDSNEAALSGAAFNPRTGTGIATNRYVNEDEGWGESLITRDDKWVKSESNWDGNSSTTQLETSRAGSGQVDRTVSGDSVTREGQFQRGDKSLETRSQRNEQGSATGFKAGDGRTGGVARSSGGDLYAGSDGQVYKRDDNGWQQRDGDDWKQVEVPDERAAQIDKARGQVSDKRSEIKQSDRAGSASQRRQELGVDRQRSTRDIGSKSQSRSRSSDRRTRSFNSGRKRELNRNYQARNRGYERYNNRQSRAGGMQRSRPARSRSGGRQR